MVGPGDTPGPGAGPREELLPGLPFLRSFAFGRAQPFGDPFGASNCAVMAELATEELAQRESRTALRPALTPDPLRLYHRGSPCRSGRRGEAQVTCAHASSQREAE